MRSSQTKEPLRHGDLLLIPVPVLKEVGKPANKTLAYGETTGHEHRLTGQCLVYEAPQKKLGELYPELAGEQHLKDAMASKFLTAQETILLRHVDGSSQKADHEALYIPQGNYAVVQEREYDFFEEEIRRVSD